MAGWISINMSSYPSFQSISIAISLKINVHPIFDVIGDINQQRLLADFHSLNAAVL